MVVNVFVVFFKPRKNDHPFAFLERSDDNTGTTVCNDDVGLFDLFIEFCLIDERFIRVMFWLILADTRLCEDPILGGSLRIKSRVLSAICPVGISAILSLRKY